MSTNHECQHGQLARQCEICELRAEVERLRSELQRVQAYIDETPELFEALGPLDNGLGSSNTNASRGGST